MDPSKWSHSPALSVVSPTLFAISREIDFFTAWFSSGAVQCCRRARAGRRGGVAESLTVVLRGAREGSDGSRLTGGLIFPNNESQRVHICTVQLLQSPHHSHFMILSGTRTGGDKSLFFTFPTWWSWCGPMHCNTSINTGKPWDYVSSQGENSSNYFSHKNNLELLFEFQDETGVLQKLKHRYASENFSSEADLKIVFTDLIRSLCELDQKTDHRPLTKIDGYQHLTNMLLMGQFQSRHFYTKFKYFLYLGRLFT